MRPIRIPPANKPGMRLDHLLASRFALRPDQTIIRRAAELPASLQRRVSTLTSECEWRAYRVANSVFCAIGRSASAGRADPDSAAIEVYLLDSRAAVYSATVWQYDDRHGWWQDSMVDISYDCERGWWSDALTRPPMTMPGSSSGRPRALLEAANMDAV